MRKWTNKLTSLRILFEEFAGPLESIMRFPKTSSTKPGWFTMYNTLNYEVGNLKVVAVWIKKLPKITTETLTFDIWVESRTC